MMMMYGCAFCSFWIEATSSRDAHQRMSAHRRERHPEVSRPDGNWWIPTENGGAVPVTADQAESWRRENPERWTVAASWVGPVKVSTVFTFRNFAMSPNEKPVLWSTIVFGGNLDGEEDRYPSLEEAKEGHEAMVARVRQTIGEAAFVEL